MESKKAYTMLLLLLIVSLYFFISFHSTTKECLEKIDGLEIETAQLNKEIKKLKVGTDLLSEAIENFWQKAPDLENSRFFEFQKFRKMCPDVVQVIDKQKQRELDLRKRELERKEAEDTRDWESIEKALGLKKEDLDFEKEKFIEEFKREGERQTREEKRQQLLDIQKRGG